VNTEQIQYCISNEVLSGIYKIIAPDGFYYIGSSNNLTRRWSEHSTALKCNKHRNLHVQNRYNKTPDGWRFILLEQVVDIYKLEQIEQNYLNLHKADEFCMNICTDTFAPRRGVVLSEDTKLKMSAAHTGKKLTREHKENISKSLKGKKRAYRKRQSPTLETRLKISLSKKKYKYTKTHRDNLRLARIGKKMSLESIAKRTETRKMNRISKLNEALT
jgi:group I intron endonuclease